MTKKIVIALATCAFMLAGAANAAAPKKGGAPNVLQAVGSVISTPAAQAALANAGITDVTVGNVGSNGQVSVTLQVTSGGAVVNVPATVGLAGGVVTVTFPGGDSLSFNVADFS